MPYSRISPRAPTRRFSRRSKARAGTRCGYGGAGAAARRTCCKPCVRRPADLPRTSRLRIARCRRRPCWASRTAASSAWTMPVPQRAICRGNGHCSDCSTRPATRVLGWSSPRAPRQLPWRLEDWRSRAGACVIYHVRELDETGRAQALKLRAAQRGITLPAETLEYLMRRVPRDLPSLLRLLDELDEASLAAQRRLTIPFIRDALEKHADTKP